MLLRANVESAICPFHEARSSLRQTMVMLTSHSSSDVFVCLEYFCSSGHTRLHRIPFLDREETRKKERLERQETKKKKVAEEETDENNFAKNEITWVKYTLGVKHSVTNTIVTVRNSKQHFGAADFRTVSVEYGVDSRDRVVNLNLNSIQLASTGFVSMTWSTPDLDQDLARHSVKFMDPDFISLDLPKILINKLWIHKLLN